MPRTPIKAIVFDLGKVIVPFDFYRAYARLEAHSGIPARDIQATLGRTGLYSRFECGQLDAPGFIAAITDHLGIRLASEEFRDIWTSVFLPETLVSDGFLRALAVNYRLVLLSNTNVIHFEMIRESYPLLGHFSAFVLSYEVGAMKPAPVIYQKAIAAAACAAAECVFIDDIAENVEGARLEGMNAVQFLSASDLERDLQAFGVNWKREGRGENRE